MQYSVRLIGVHEGVAAIGTPTEDYIDDWYGGYSVIPEPSTFSLFAAGIFGLSLHARRGARRFKAHRKET
jgi:hypothetical protein